MFRKIFFILTLLSSQLIAEKQPIYIEGELHGQLGNQMFIIAATYAHARAHDAMAVFPNLLTEQVSDIPLNYEKIFSHLDTQTPPSNRTRYIEPFFHYQPFPFDGDMVVRGYFQSEKYFFDYKDEIIQLFQPSQEIEQILNNQYQHILNHPKSVAIHVRWYHGHPIECHPFVGINYLKKAVDFFDEDSLFVVFSDDIISTKRMFNKIKKRNVQFIENNPHYIDFYLMSRCKHQIISNSTFSWWAAYLNPNSEKTVISPSFKRWFGPGFKEHDTKDLIPPQWIQIQ